ncbi:MAG: hypothetical protein ABH983_03670 [Candidatus Micrarchaeota archaeon]
MDSKKTIQMIGYLFGILTLLSFAVFFFLPTIMGPRDITYPPCEESIFFIYLQTCSIIDNDSCDASFLYANARALLLQASLLFLTLSVFFLGSLTSWFKYKKKKSSKEMQKIALSLLVVFVLIATILNFNGQCAEYWCNGPSKNYADAGKSCTDSSQCLGVCMNIECDGGQCSPFCSSDDPCTRRKDFEELSETWYEVVDGSLEERHAFNVDEMARD